MPKEYNQFRAMLAITKASLKATFRSPSAIIFSIGFPMIFILVFGFIGGGSGISLDIAIDKKSDTLNAVYGAIQRIGGIHLSDKTNEAAEDDLAKGRLTAILTIERTGLTSPAYNIHIKSSEAVRQEDIQVLQSILDAVIGNINKIEYPDMPTIASISKDIQKIPGREYRRIDFILPGQLGFSLLSAGVFGVAFLFFNLRQQLVLKRFFATPVRKPYIIMGEAISRVVFQMMTAVIIVGLGSLVFKFTLVNGFITFMEVMVLSFLMLLVSMGFGFFVSSVAKNEHMIPPFANLITLPQFLLAGTFFPVEVFPKWLQGFCNLLPLTHFNNAMRNIAFEGQSLAANWGEVAILILWGIVIYSVVIKVFKWE